MRSSYTINFKVATTEVHVHMHMAEWPEVVQRARQILKDRRAESLRIYKANHCVRKMDGALFGWKGTPTVFKATA